MNTPNTTITLPETPASQAARDNRIRLTLEDAHKVIASRHLKVLTVSALREDGTIYIKIDAGSEMFYLLVKPLLPEVEFRCSNTSIATDAFPTAEEALDAWKTRVAQYHSKIQTQATAWYEREQDKVLTLTEAIAYTQDLANHSKAREMELDDFEVSFNAGAVQLTSRRSEVGPSFRWTLNHWSFGQLCTLISAPASFLRTLPGDLAVECLNVKLRQRNRAVKIYRTLSGVQGVQGDTIRALTSKRYKRYHDHQILEWVRDAGMPTSNVFASDRGIEICLFGKKVLAPDRAEANLLLSVGNSEVGAASISTTAYISRGEWRIPITLAGARVRHTGDVDAKAMEKLTTAKDAFTNVQTTDLEKELAETAIPVTKTQGEWFAWLKSRRVGKTLAKKILPEPNDLGEISVSRWDLAIKLAFMAAKIPYFDDRIEEEIKAAKVLGV